MYAVQITKLRLVYYIQMHYCINIPNYYYYGWVFTLLAAAAAEEEELALLTEGFLTTENPFVNP